MCMCVCVRARRFCFWQCALSLRDVLSQGCSAVHTFPVDEAFNCEPVIIRFMFKLIFFAEKYSKGSAWFNCLFKIAHRFLWPHIVYLGCRFCFLEVDKRS